MSITDRSAASTDPIEQTVQFGRIAAAIEYLYDHAADHPTLAQVSQAVHVNPNICSGSSSSGRGEPQENAAAYQP
ncbi:ADA regulatory protein [Rothia aeria]|uniref:ADA regulatory protein n=1 Tax=Rothia aeria TaxID=172042 RepID=A0A2Z5QWE4_9MICC|nr:ADA regulatory protein [Rothia aeria]